MCIHTFSSYLKFLMNLDNHTIAVTDSNNSTWIKTVRMPKKYRKHKKIIQQPAQWLIIDSSKTLFCMATITYFSTKSQFPQHQPLFKYWNSKA